MITFLVDYCSLTGPRLVQKINIAPENEIDIYNGLLLGPTTNQYNIFMLKANQDILN